MKNSSVDVYVDGSIDVNKTDEFSRGSAAAVLVEVSGNLVTNLRIITEFYTGFETVTNNRMELRAIETALKGVTHHVGYGVSFRLISDSKYALNSVFGTNKAHANKELIEDIKDTISGFELDVVSFHTPGHKGSFLNEVADYAARETVAQEKAITASFTPKSTEYDCLTCARFPDCVSVGHRLTMETFKHVIRSLWNVEWRSCDLRVAYSSAARKSRRPQSSPSGSIRSGR